MIQVVERLDEVWRQRLEGYLARAGARAGASGEHDPRWLEVLREGLGHRPIALVAGRNGSAGGEEIRGYLPLALVRSRLFGRFLVSLPYLNRAGVVADDAEVASELIEQAVELSEELDVRYLELRQGGVCSQHRAFNATRGEKVRMVLPLPQTPEELWRAIPSKVRNLVRKGDGTGLTIRWGGRELVDDFYRVFAVNMRDLGTPVYPRRLFEAIVRWLSDRAELAVVDCGGRPMAGALLVHDPGVTQVPSASSLRAYNHTNANMWMYYRLLARAVERGSREFDFGRSTVDSGTYRFKKQWGAQPQPTVWQYHLRCGDLGDMRPESPKNRRRVAVWQRLPVWVTRLVGPAIVRGIP